MRIAILGNSGSGKSTLAHWLAARSGAALLDLDTIAWEPNRIAVPRSPDAARADLLSFCESSPDWVIEGCYGSLVTAAFPFRPRLVFLNPGAEQCVANCRARPWEPHKYASKSEQDERLEFLLDWVRDYEMREGEMSLAGHRECFAAYTGPKVELFTQPVLDPPDEEVLAWLG